MPSIAELRRDNPWASDYNDAELVTMFAEHNKLPLQDAASMFNYAAPTSTTGKSISSAIDRYQAGLYHVGAALGSDWAGRQAAKNEAEANLVDAGNDAVKTWDDVHSLSDFGSYVKHGAIQSAPYMVEAVGTGFGLGSALKGVGTAAARGLGERAIGRKAAELIARNPSVGEEAAMRLAAEDVATGYARSAGAGIGSYPSSVGQLLSRQHEENGDYDLGTAAAFGVPYAALNTVGLEGQLLRGMPRGLSASALRRGAVGFAEGALPEAGAEMSQTFLERTGAGLDAFGPGSAREYIDSGILGGVLGGVPGAASAGFRGPAINREQQLDLLQTGARRDTVAAHAPQAGVDTRSAIYNGPDPRYGQAMDMFGAGYTDVAQAPAAAPEMFDPYGAERFARQQDWIDQGSTLDMLSGQYTPTAIPSDVAAAPFVAGDQQTLDMFNPNGTPTYYADTAANWTGNQPAYDPIRTRGNGPASLSDLATVARGINESRNGRFTLTPYGRSGVMAGENGGQFDASQWVPQQRELAVIESHPSPEQQLAEAFDVYRRRMALFNNIQAKAESGAMVSAYEASILRAGPPQAPQAPAGPSRIALPETRQTPEQLINTPMTDRESTRQAVENAGRAWVASRGRVGISQDDYVEFINDLDQGRWQDVAKRLSATLESHRALQQAPAAFEPGQNAKAVEDQRARELADRMVANGGKLTLSIKDLLGLGIPLNRLSIHPTVHKGADVKPPAGQRFKTTMSRAGISDSVTITGVRVGEGGKKGVIGARPNARKTVTLLDQIRRVGDNPELVQMAKDALAGMAYTDIAERYGVTPGTVTNRMQSIGLSEDRFNEFRRTHGLGDDVTLADLFGDDQHGAEAGFSVSETPVAGGTEQVTEESVASARQAAYEADQRAVQELEIEKADYEKQLEKAQATGNKAAVKSLKRRLKSVDNELARMERIIAGHAKLDANRAEKALKAEEARAFASETEERRIERRNDALAAFTPVIEQEIEDEAALRRSLSRFMDSEPTAEEEKTARDEWNDSMHQHVKDGDYAPLWNNLGVADQARVINAMRRFEAEKRSGDLKTAYNRMRTALEDTYNGLGQDNRGLGEAAERAAENPADKVSGTGPRTEAQGDQGVRSESDGKDGGKARPAVRSLSELKELLTEGRLKELEAKGVSPETLENIRKASLNQKNPVQWFKDTLATYENQLDAAVAADMAALFEAEASGETPDFRTGAAPTAPMSQDAVQKIVDDFLSQYPAAKQLRVIVMPDTNHWGAAGDAIKGAYYAKSGIVAVVSSNHSNAAEVFETLQHEFMGHMGLDLFKPADKRAILNFVRQAARINPKLKAMYAAELVETNGDADLAASEVLANLSEGLRGMGQAFIDSLRKLWSAALKAVGLRDKGYVTEAELRDHLRLVKYAMERGYQRQTAPATDHVMFRKGTRTQQQYNQWRESYPKMVWETVKALGKKFLMGGMFLNDLKNFTKSAAVAKFIEAVQDKLNQRTQLERSLRDVEERFYNLKSEVQDAANAFLKYSTLSKKWGFQPSWDSKAVVDPEAKAKFDALKKLDPRAAQIIMDVFTEGYKQLKAREEALNNRVLGKKAAQLKSLEMLRDEAKAANDPKLVADVEKSIKQWKDAMAKTEPMRAMTVAQMRTPYVPLTREGEYAVVFKSKEYAAAEERDDQKALRQMKGDSKHYQVYFEANALAARQRANAVMAGNEQFRHLTRDEIIFAREPKTFSQEMPFDIYERLLVQSENEDFTNMSDLAASVTKAKLQAAITDLYIGYLNEQHTRKSEMERMGVHGFDEDMMRGFVRNGKRDATFVSAINTAEDVMSALAEVRREAKIPGADRTSRATMANEILKRYTNSLDYRETPWQDAFMRFNSVWMLLSNPAYYLQNSLQPWVVSVPTIAANQGSNGKSYGTAQTTKRMWAAYDTVRKLQEYAAKEGTGFEINEQTVPDEGERKMLNTLLNRSHLDVTINAELGEAAKQANQGRAGKFLNWAGRKMRHLAQHVEMANRVATALAAYRLHMENNGGNAEAATEFADKMVVDTHGDYSGHNAPRWFMQGRSNLPIKAMTQFKKFQLIQASLLVRALNDSMRGESPEAKAVGRRIVRNLILNHAVFAGTLGSPVIGSAMWVAAALGKDDGEDKEEAMRRFIGDKAIADLALHGVPGALGVNVTNKIGMGGSDAFGIFNPMPFTHGGKNAKETASNVLWGLAGPAGSQVQRAANAYDFMAKGDYYKGLEQLAPAFVRNTMTAYRFGTEGMTARSGDVMLSKDEFNMIESFMQAAGLPTLGTTERNRKMGVLLDTKQSMTDTFSTIKHSYLKAQEAGNSAEMTELAGEWRDASAKFQKLGLVPPKIKDLYSAPREQDKRERKVSGGLPTTKNTRVFVERLNQT